MGGIFFTSAYRTTWSPWASSHLPSVCQGHFNNKFVPTYVKKNYYRLEKELSVMVMLIKLRFAITL